MGRRKRINSEIVKDIRNYWTIEKRADILKRIRKGVFLEVGPFELIEESKIQAWAHSMVQKDKSEAPIAQHADRFDIKTSLRRYLRKQTITYLQLQKYFPELFEEGNTHGTGNGTGDGTETGSFGQENTG
jgi:hypothetical protein